MAGAGHHLRGAVPVRLHRLRKQCHSGITCQGMQSSRNIHLSCCSASCQDELHSHPCCMVYPEQSHRTPIQDLLFAICINEVSPAPCIPRNDPPHCQHERLQCSARLASAIRVRYSCSGGPCSKHPSPFLAAQCSVVMSAILVRYCRSSAVPIADALGHCQEAQSILFQPSFTSLQLISDPCI